MSPSFHPPPSPSSPARSHPGRAPAGPPVARGAVPAGPSGTAQRNEQTSTAAAVAAGPAGTRAGGASLPTDGCEYSVSAAAGTSVAAADREAGAGVTTAPSRTDEPEAGTADTATAAAAGGGRTAVPAGTPSTGQQPDTIGTGAILWPRRPRRRRRGPR
ncbi:hypothetical protein B1T50_26315 [Mycobacterium kansasii]|nr:hypothetical protein B1T50_26315 [Mycobacterium kansasii]